MRAGADEEVAVASVGASGAVETAVAVMAAVAVEAAAVDVEPTVDVEAAVEADVALDAKAAVGVDVAVGSVGPWQAEDICRASGEVGISRRFLVAATRPVKYAARRLAGWRAPISPNRILARGYILPFTWRHTCQRIHHSGYRLLCL